MWPEDEEIEIEARKGRPNIYHLFVQGSICIETQTDHVDFKDIT